jgi:glycine/D-amino acid oxidase-like deaminating enzyme/nitrite reductase/ring-hydroxylating ferredoxin subunit
VLERDRCAAVDTGHTTAHLTMVTDQLITDLVDAFGHEVTTAVWDAGRVAIDLIERHVRDESIACDFRRVPGFLHTALVGTGLSKDELRAQVRTASELGFDARYEDSIAPFGVAGARFDNQALFHPRKYLAGLLPSIDGQGSYVFEHSNVDGVTDDPLTVEAGNYRVSCHYVVIATHTPLMGKTNMLSATLLQSKIAPYITYAIGGRVPPGMVPDGLYWDTHDPYHYLRVHPAEGHGYLIFGGADHKTGQQPDTLSSWAGLERTLRRYLPYFEMTDQWSGQVIETVDGLPYIGEITDRQFIATGFVGNGITFGTIAGVLARDAVLGRQNPWRNVFDPHRKPVPAGVWQYVVENKDYAYYMVRDYLFARHRASLQTLRPGRGEVLHLDGHRVAAYRDERGVVSLCSAVCTHMGCEVHFNQAETSWDCPCHGSRFRIDGSVIGGPAEQPLAPYREED